RAGRLCRVINHRSVALLRNDLRAQPITRVAGTPLSILRSIPAALARMPPTTTTAIAKPNPGLCQGKPKMLRGGDTRDQPVGSSRPALVRTCDDSRARLVSAKPSPVHPTMILDGGLDHVLIRHMRARTPQPAP